MSLTGLRGTPAFSSASSQSARFRASIAAMIMSELEARGPMS
jgi:hypothetical protein